ncbi:hypothetical protein B0H14DRAFT_2797760 [Mycena olivaceomarginata]|nr:hypothetical protein B0H14DRAFT_2797760 [Mycena olivaceomarginata]
MRVCRDHSDHLPPTPALTAGRSRASTSLSTGRGCPVETTSLYTSSLSTRCTARSQRSAQLFITADTPSSSRGPPAAHALFRPSPSPPPLSSPASAGGPEAHRTSAGSLPLRLAPVARSSQAVSVLPSLARTPRPSPPSCSAPLCDGHLLAYIPFLGSGPHAAATRMSCQLVSAAAFG